jgi:hypothetical protein
MTHNMKQWLALLAFYGAAALPAHAQRTLAAPSAAETCLTLTQGAATKPEYPEEALLRKAGGTVSVRMVFSDAESAPDVDLQGNRVAPLLMDVVRKHVAQYRVPCLKAGEPAVTMTQDFVFDPNGGRKVMHSDPVDVEAAQRQAQLACLKVVELPLRRDTPYGLDGAAHLVITRMHFKAPDRAPEIEWLATPNLTTAVKEHVKAYAARMRLPCLKQGPVVGLQVFQFTSEDQQEVVLKDMSLKAWVGSAKAFPEPAYFDFTTMGCPFEVRISYYQPYLPNRVAEFDTSNPARRTFLDWLAHVTLNLDEKTNMAVTGGRVVLAVPCGKLDL